MDKKVSIIIAMYNSAEFLEQCVESILCQTIDDYEIILVNDCSPDNSLDLAMQYARKYPEKIEIINHDHNQRAGAARNNGLKAAKGKYVWFVDADDWLAPTALEETVQIAENNSSDLVSVDYYEVVSKGEQPISLQIGIPDEFTGVMDRKKREGYIVNCQGGFSKLIRREFLIQNELFYPEGILFEDNGIVPLIGAVADRIDTIHKGLYFYRISNPNSQTSIVRRESVMIDRMKAMEYFLNKSVALGIQEELHEGIEYFFVYIYYISIIRFYIKGKCDISKDTFKKMKSETYRCFPRFKHNKYIKERFSYLNRAPIYVAEFGFPAIQVLKRFIHLISKTRN